MAVESLKARAEAVEAEVIALSLAVRDDRTPVAAKALLAVLVAYAASPIDPIPDVLPVVGYLDELVVLPVGVAVAVRLVPDEVMAESRERAEEAVDVGRARWLGAVLVVLGWVLLGGLALWSLSGVW